MPKDGTSVITLRRPSADVRLDRLDVKILTALQQDGRITNRKLAELVGLSPTPCLQRVRRLKAKGYIQGYGAVLNAARLWSHIKVFTEVSLRSRLREDTQPFERYVRTQPLITECCAVGGAYDYLLKVIARDVAHYQAILDDMIAQKVGVANYHSFISLREVKQTRDFPIALFQGVPEPIAGTERLFEVPEGLRRYAAVASGD